MAPALLARVAPWWRLQWGTGATRSQSAWRAGDWRPAPVAPVAVAGGGPPWWRPVAPWWRPVAPGGAVVAPWWRRGGVVALAWRPWRVALVAPWWHAAPCARLRHVPASGGGLAPRWPERPRQAV